MASGRTLLLRSGRKPLCFSTLVPPPGRVHRGQGPFLQESHAWRAECTFLLLQVLSFLRNSQCKTSDTCLALPLAQKVCSESHVACGPLAHVSKFIRVPIWANLR
ncbi:hypothetical protein CALVIDRAFT_381099 [Calocera viscosa TUFC12733]|uniref:Uncharacterized protein n=1 Tax=Calocera viscosa (strain TUFC12733) TaxID=1330018 RepID=A0A167Q5J6_CALVF|nr:hypothetical protein CALVIDRAFT_381099 [Calocera viscosa TUFC12733]